MYQNHSAIINSELLPWVERLSGLSPDQIQPYIDHRAVTMPTDVRELLQKHEWVTAARAICMRAPEDNPDAWRNALPPDRVPIVLAFNEGVLETKDGAITTIVTDSGFTVLTDAAKEYIHKNDYRYIGVDEEGRHQFINTVTRSHKVNEDDITVGHELVVLAGEGMAVSLYLGNDGKTKGLPAEFREIRILKDLSTAYGQVIKDIHHALQGLPDQEPDLEKQTVKRRGLNTHLANYQGHMAALNAG